MPRPPVDNQRIRDERQEQILLAAAHVFARTGLAATKITDIAAAAGVSHGLAYHYFPSKEEIFRQLVTRALAGIARVLHDAAAQQGTVTDRLAWLANALVVGARDADATDYNLIIQQAMISDVVPADIRALVLQEPSKLLALLSGLLREGQDAGEIIAGDPDQLAYLFLSCIQGIVSSATLYAQQTPLEPALLIRLFQAR